MRRCIQENENDSRWRKRTSPANNCKSSSSSASQSNFTFARGKPRGDETAAVPPSPAAASTAATFCSCFCSFSCARHALSKSSQCAATMRLRIIRNEIIKNVGKCQSCMVSELRAIFKRTRSCNRHAVPAGLAAPASACTAEWPLPCVLRAHVVLPAASSPPCPPAAPALSAHSLEVWPLPPAPAASTFSASPLLVWRADRAASLGF